jgi:hypothetical protein
MLLCDYCKDPKKVVVSRYFLGTVRCFDGENFQFPKSVDKNNFTRSIDLCDFCADNLDNNIGWLLCQTRKGLTNSEIFV